MGDVTIRAEIKGLTRPEQAATTFLAQLKRALYLVDGDPAGPGKFSADIMITAPGRELTYKYPEAETRIEPA
ncbi:MAG: hypothetical protein ACREP9_08260 [Candidatus Dormibacteraceae bacterium]